MKKVSLLSITLILGFSINLFSGNTTQINVSVNQTPCTLTGINETDNAVFYKIFPNPSNGLITIESINKLLTQDINVKITNVIGDIILESKLSNTLTEVDFSKQPNGIYLVIIREGQNIVFEEKVIKK